MRLIPKHCRLPLMVLVAVAALAGCKEKHRSAYALTSTNTIIKFETNAPQTIESEATVSGLDSGDSLLQIDIRPANSTMYGITQNMFVVSINPDTGVATKVSTTAFTPPTMLVAPIVMDINPVGDYLRIIDFAGSSTARTNNFRVSFDNPPIVTNDQSTNTNTALYYNVNDTNSGQIPELASIAHSNNVSGASNTTLYGLDITTQALVTIAANQLKTVADCGHAFVSGNTGFDIVPDSDQGFAALGGSGENAVFYEVNLNTCNLNRVDEIGGARRILSLAVTLKDDNSNDN
jgi:hypothetical protein